MNAPTRVPIAVAALVALFALTALGSIGANLADMHLPGQRSGQITDVASPSADEGDVEAVLSGWNSWDVAREGTPAAVYAGSGAVAAWWLIVDSLVLAPAVAALLFLIARHRRDLLPSSWLAPVLGVCLLGSLAYLLLDELENIATAWVVFRQPDGWNPVFRWGLSGGKWLALILTAVPILLSYIPRVRRERPLETRPLWSTVRVMRMPAVAAASAAVVMTQLPAGVRPQIEDVIRSWAEDDRLSHAMAAIAALVLLMATIGAAMAWVGRRDAQSQPTPPPVDQAFRTPAPSAAIRRFAVSWQWAALFVIGGCVAIAWWHQPLGKVAGFGLMVYAVVSIPVTDAERVRRSSTELNGNVLRAILVAPAFSFALMVVRSIDLMGGWPLKSLGFAVGGAGIAIAFAGWYLARYLVGHASDSTGLRQAALFFGAVAVVALALGVAAGTEPLGMGWSLGSVALLLLFTTCLLAVLTVVEQLVWSPPAGAFAGLHLHRFPVVAVLLLALVLVSQFDRRVDMHAARVIARETPLDDVTLTSEELLDQYNGPVAGDPATEVVFVIATAGGGARSAYWTLDVLNCLFADTPPPSFQQFDDPDDQASPAQHPTDDPDEIEDADEMCDGDASWDRVLAASGVSGGSVGLAMFDATRPDDPDDGREPFELEETFDRGFLDPTFASLLFRDAPNAWVRATGGDDRAATLEQSWESEVDELRQGFLASQTDPTDDGRRALAGFPVLMFNSAGATDGCRINVSALDLAAETPAEEVAPAAPGDEAEPSDGEEVTSSVGATSLAPQDVSCRTLDVVDSGQGTQLPGALSSTRDVADWVCHGDGGDLPMSTAALLSARFPFVSPTGALEWCHGEVDASTPNIFAVDGGYIESTAASPLTELLSMLLVGTQRDDAASSAGQSATCLQPVVLQIDNGYVSETQPSAPGRPLELTAPLTGSNAAGAARGDAARQALAALAAQRCPDLGVFEGLRTYLHITPVAHPGIEAPLGWSLSAGARRDLDAQLVLGDDNRCALEQAKVWLATEPDDADVGPACDRASTAEEEVRDELAATEGDPVDLADDWLGVLLVVAPIGGLALFVLGVLVAVGTIGSRRREGPADEEPTRPVAAEARAGEGVATATLVVPEADATTGLCPLGGRLGRLGPAAMAGVSVGLIGANAVLVATTDGWLDHLVANVGLAALVMWLLSGFPRPPGRWSDVVDGVGSSLRLAFPYAGALVVVITLVGFVVSADPPDDYSWPYLLLWVPIGAALTEEYLFREVLLRGWVDTPLGRAGGSALTDDSLWRWLGSRAARRAPILLNVVVFGLWHVPSTWPLGSPVDALAVIVPALGAFLFCWLRLRTGNIAGAVLVHAAVNASALLAFVGLP